MLQQQPLVSTASTGWQCLVTNATTGWCMCTGWRVYLRKTSKPSVTGLCEGNSTVTGEFPAQRASNRENVSIWWRHHLRSIKVLSVYLFFYRWLKLGLFFLCSLLICIDLMYRLLLFLCLWFFFIRMRWTSVLQVKFMRFLFIILTSQQQTMPGPSRTRFYRHLCHNNAAIYPACPLSQMQ